MAKFCANISFMFNNMPLVDRYVAAKNAGFKAVESGFPFNYSLDLMLLAKSNADIEQVLINTYTGDVTKGEMGFAAIPGKTPEFRKSMEKTITYAKALKVKKIHIMAGNVAKPTPKNDVCYIENLRMAAKMLEANNIMGVIEPINNHTVPDYYLNSYEKATDVVKCIDSPNLKIMLDLFHMQKICGNLTMTIEKLVPYTGHVQIAQSPDRHEPDSPGEINYPYVLDVLRKAGYNDWIGLEYKPAGDLVSGLKWIQSFGYEL
ncbi:PREDICTED: putative hydroxypyruvate isomerase [Nicrophorus vespilloides]|uniref:Putative hydroxypyruvate isomerase n=1 Tax=Nicrophorus vespilloides TaxID=110193 RepID=A0ABM1NFC3_NICVS|nr:PREDICTED: putative hydroxypyruvate isomerase [Nicrophorus vespilloides]